MDGGSLQEGLLGSPAAEITKPVGTSWVKIAFIIVTNFLGAGVLSLPFSASSLGYALFLSMLTVIFLLALLSGRAFGKCFRQLPDSRAMSDIGKAAFGRRGEVVVRAIQYFYMCGVLVILHLTCAISLGRSVGGGCAVMMSAVTGLAALITMQARGTSALGSMGGVGTACIFVYIGIILVMLPLRGRHGDADTDLLPPSTSSSVAKGVAMMDIVFAFAGQVIYIELQSEMAAPRDFMRSVTTSNTLMFVTYVAIAVLGYHFVGEKDLASGAPITSAIASKGSIVDRVVNGFLFVQVLIAYTIEGNIIARGLFMVNGEDGASVSRPRWTAATAGLVALAFLVSNLVPRAARVQKRPEPRVVDRRVLRSRIARPYRPPLCSNRTREPRPPPKRWRGAHMGVSGPAHHHRPPLIIARATQAAAADVARRPGI